MGRITSGSELMCAHLVAVATAVLVRARAQGCHQTARWQPSQTRVR